MTSPLDQKPRRRPIRNCRSLRPCVPVISVLPFRFLIDPSGFSCRLDTLVPGLLNCGVLVTLKHSARSWKSRPRPRENLRNRPRSQLQVRQARRLRCLRGGRARNREADRDRRAGQGEWSHWRHPTAAYGRQENYGVDGISDLLVTAVLADAPR
jgi:hypothetical protein